MESTMNILILLSFIFEVSILTYFEKKIWNTIYTPLNFLMLPYTLVLLVTLCVSGNMGFVDFYYPSILLWSVGLIIFFLPSLVLGMIFNKEYRKPLYILEDFEIRRPFLILMQIIALLFIMRFIMVFRSSEFIVGSDEFGEELCKDGFWGHLRVFTTALLILLIYKIDRAHKSYFIYITIFILIGLLYQVKGWIIIPCVAGVSLRLLSGKMKLKVSLILKILLAGFLLFQVSYILTFAVAGDSEVGWEIVEYIAGHFFHYFTSGTFGLSMDMQNDFMDRRGIEVIFTPLYNIFSQFTGDELISPINPVYYNPGLDLTNVRTFFGTLYINTTLVQAFIYTLVLSTFVYLIKILSILSHEVIIYAIYLFFCSLLAMGWFEFYFFHLDVIEVPIFLGVIYLIRKCRFNLYDICLK